MALEGRNNQDELWEMLFEEGFHRFHFVYQPDPVTGGSTYVSKVLNLVAGLLPGEEAASIEKVSEEGREGDEKSVKSKDDKEVTEVGGAGGDTHDGKVAIEVGGDSLGKLGAAAAAGQMRTEENLGQRVVEVDTSDEEVEIEERDVKGVGELHHQSDVKDERDSQPSQGRAVVVEVESDDEEPIMEDMDSMATGLSNILPTKFT